MNRAPPIDTIKPAPRRPFYLQLWFLVLVAMVIGIALGHFYPDAGVAMEPLGDAFIRAIRVLIAPIIFCTVVHGIASMADMAKVGRVALKALIYFEVLTTIALIIGLVAVNVFQPGAGMNVDLSHIDTSSVATYLAQTQSRTTAQFLLNIIPNTFIGAFSEGNVLQVLYVSVLCGFALERHGQCRQAAHRSDRNGGADVLSHRRHRDVGGADRRVRRHRLHRRQVRRRLAGVARQTSDHLLSHLLDLHLRGAVADLSLVPRQPVALHPLHPRRASDRDRDHVIGNGAAAHDRQARSGGLRGERGRARDPDRLFVQSRRHLSLSGDRGGIPGASHQHAAIARGISCNSWRFCSWRRRAPPASPARPSSC